MNYLTVDFGSSGANTCNELEAITLAYYFKYYFNSKDNLAFAYSSFSFYIN